MTKKTFENNYLNKQVEITLTNGEILKGYLYSTNEFKKKIKNVDKKNYYFVADNIYLNSVRFRKTHIKKIKLLNSGKIYKLKAVNTLIEKVMYYLNIKDYRYDVVDNILFIYEPIIIGKFVILKTILCNILIVIKRKGIMLTI